MFKKLLSFLILLLVSCGGGGGGSPTEPEEPAPVANFTATPSSLIQGEAVTFTSTSTGTITSYAWNVDDDPAIDGTTETYAHTYSDVGIYSVTLTVTGPGGSNPKTVADMITVSTAAPTPTTATTQTVQEDGSTTINLTATDPNGQAVTFAITTDPTYGTATLSGSEVTYTPNANFYGTDSFAYTASNGTYTSDPATINITVEGQDDEPTTNDVSASTDEDTAVTVDLDATEVDGDNYSFNIVSQPSNGTLGSVNGNQVEYTPNQDWNGTDTFTFEATDNRTSGRNVATATITVNPVNDAPLCYSTTASVDYGSSVTINMNCTDVDSSNLTYIISTDPTSGAVSISGNVATYSPSGHGTDNFQFKANDGELDSNNADVAITINSDEAGFTIDVESSNAYAPQRLNFTNTSETASSFLWDFGDGNTSSDENPVHTYSNAGTYQISQSIVGPINTDTKTIDYTVNTIPSSNAVYTEPKYIFQKAVSDIITVNINALNLASAEINVSLPPGVELYSYGLVGTSILEANGVSPYREAYWSEPEGTDGRDFRVLTSALDEDAMDTTGTGELFSFNVINSNQTDVEIGYNVILLDGSGNELTPGAVIGTFLIESSASKFGNEGSKYFEETFTILQSKPEGN